ncbi:hypothetical protein GLX30_15625 [Streptomyces sp. Tu 2975]|uniref:hypothetical protein n=1 Tax=Streptomyces sp. Tu 2975 TaxID=2676871 RepID=UPI001359F329|nr:hypothetical protein [Streptomyces sp. Tu 2975]QIP85222.1 hypothetical protein GLX30_15625 [Streptomyces sp. Tu 2975]
MSGRNTPQDPNTSQGTANAPEGARSAGSWPLVLLLPSMLLLRFLGEHSWAYWTAAVLGVPGLVAAAVALTGCLRNLVRGHRPWNAAGAGLLLIGASFVVVVRLVER